MSETGILLYCIASTFNEDFEKLRGLDEDSNLFFIEEQGLYGIGSYVNLHEYGEENVKAKAEDVHWIAEKASRFMDIIMRINSMCMVIPMKFLTIFNSEDRIRDIIRENTEKIKSNFERLFGKEEISLKIYCNSKTFKETSMEEEISLFEESIAGKPKGSAFFLRKKFDSELDDKVQGKICTMSNSMIEEATPYYFAMKSNKLLAKEISGVADKMILNCAFLVEVQRRRDFEDYIQSLTETYEACGFTFQITGPWPPYNFCEL